MGKYCIFLRGINVNGIAIKMDALKDAFGRMGFTGARTILATGNVIIGVPEGADHREEIKSSVESGLSGYFSYDAHVIVRSCPEIRDICLAAETLDVPEDCHNYYLLCDDEEMPSGLKNLFDSLPHAPQEQLFPSGGGAFWTVPKGSTLSSDFGSKVLGAKKYKSRLTSRNINTIQKVYKAMLG